MRPELITSALLEKIVACCRDGRGAIVFDEGTVAQADSAEDNIVVSLGMRGGFERRVTYINDPNVTLEHLREMLGGEEIAKIHTVCERRAYSIVRDIFQSLHEWDALYDPSYMVTAEDPAEMWRKIGRDGIELVRQITVTSRRVVEVCRSYSSPGQGFISVDFGPEGSLHTAKMCLDALRSAGYEVHGRYINGRHINTYRG